MTIEDLKKKAPITEADLPEAMKELIALTKETSVEYKFQTKNAMKEIILKEVNGSEATSEEEEEEIEMPEPGGEVDDETAKTNLAAKKPAKKDAKAEVKKPEEKKKKGKEPEPGMSLEEIKARKDVQEILNKEDYKKSDKIRNLYRKCDISIGMISKLLDIHYSFTYCVVDAFRKNHMKEEEAAKLAAGKGKKKEDVASV